MKFVFCPYCGEQLLKKEIGDEGMLPYCSRCQVPLFDNPYTCTITLVVDEDGEEVSLIRQSYGNTSQFVCVAGYLKSGETAEETCCREVMEELGLTAIRVSYINSYYFEKKDMLMLGFAAWVRKGEFSLSAEVQEAEWFSFGEAEEKLKSAGLALKLLRDYGSRYRNREEEE